MRVVHAFFIILLSLTSSTPLTEQTKPIDYSLPYQLPQNLIKPLREKTDFVLMRKLESTLSQNQRWKTLIKAKKMAVGVVDLRNPYNIRFASVNGEEMMYAASLPKLAILFASMQAIEDGELEETEAVQEDMKIMISRSDNGAATRMIDRIGYSKIEEVLTDPRYELYDKDHGGGLWVGKRYAQSGPRNPDPLLGLSHAATVDQVCRYYYLLAFGKLVNYQRSEEMLEILSDPELHHKFVNTIEKIDPDAKLYRKSGTWENWHSDSILIWGEGWRKYILVALIEDPNGETILRNLVTYIDNMMQSLQ